MSATATGWQLQGDAAAAYEAHLVPAIFAPMAGRLVAATGVSPGDHVVDAACGTGIVTRAAAGVLGRRGRITAVDVNPDMLRTARQACAEVGVDVDFRESDLAGLDLADGTADVALCQEALQFVPDRRAVLAELRRVLSPGGRFGASVLRSLAHNPVYELTVEALARHAGEEAASMLRSPFALGDGELLRADLAAVGFRDVRVRICVSEERFPSVGEFVRQEAASSPLAAELAGLGQERTTALVTELEEVLADHVDDLGLVFHNETHVLTGLA